MMTTLKTIEVKLMNKASMTLFNEELKCKDSLRFLKISGTIIFLLLVFYKIVTSNNTSLNSNITQIRRRNTVALFQRYAEAQMAQGTAPKGIEQAFAATLEISPSLWSQIKSSRPIGDKLARQIEQHAKQPTQWLDQMHELVIPPDAAEQRFLALAQQVWRQSNAKEKKQLLETLNLFKTR